MASGSSILNMATLVADKSLHCPVTLRALNGLRDLAGNIRNLQMRAPVNGSDSLLMLFFEGYFKAFLDYKLLPFLKLSYCLQNGGSMSSENHS